jgi:hypothetical protein
MPVIGELHPTLLDHANTLDPKGITASRVELLKQTNEILEDQVWIEGNLPTGHETTYRSELPEAQLVGYNEGVAPSKSRYRKLRATCATLMARSEIDKRLADLQGKKAEFLAAEDEGFIATLNNGYTRILMHGSEAADPKSIDGFLTRYSYLYPFSPGEEWLRDIVFGHIVDAGGTGEACTSLLLVGWAADKICGVYPQGSTAGMRQLEMGLETLADANGGKYPGYATQYYWDFGLCLRDPRYAVRIANVDLASLTADASAGARLIELMLKAEETIESLKDCRPAFYCSRELRYWLRMQILNKSNVNLTFDSVAGKETLRFDGIPVRRVDAMGHPEVAEAKP